MATKAKLFLAVLGLVAFVAAGVVSHSSHLTLVDQQGRTRLIYNQEKMGPLLKEDLSKLLAQGARW